MRFQILSTCQENIGVVQSGSQHDVAASAQNASRLPRLMTVIDAPKFLRGGSVSLADRAFLVLGFKQLQPFVARHAKLVFDVLPIMADARRVSLVRRPRFFAMGFSPRLLASGVFLSALFALDGSPSSTFGLSDFRVYQSSTDTDLSVDPVAVSSPPLSHIVGPFSFISHASFVKRWSVKGQDDEA